MLGLCFAHGRDKPDGTKRPLGIPTVLDRVIQSRGRGIAQVLGPRFEADFSEHSHGYRPGHSAHDAVAEMEAGWTEGRPASAGWSIATSSRSSTRSTTTG